MIQVGITGGIGSGKTTVCKVFETLGIPVFSADQRAKDLYLENSHVKERVINLIGPKAYNSDGSLNKPHLASMVFEDQTLLKALNQIIHPAVKEDYEKWLENQKGPYVLREAAILIESGAYQSCDKIIVVTAPKEMRINRVLQRDCTDRKSIEDRMANQMEDSKRLSYAHFEIKNDGKHSLIKQVLILHEALLKEVE